MLCATGGGLGVKPFFTPTHTLPDRLADAPIPRGTLATFAFRQVYPSFTGALPCIAARLSICPVRLPDSDGKAMVKTW